MDINTFYAASNLGVRDEYNTQIVKDVWSKSMSNMTEIEASDSCEAVYEAQGSDAFTRCRNAALSCNNDDACKTLSSKFNAALIKGYSGDFESFKKKSNVLANLGEISGGIIKGLLNGGSSYNNSNTDNGYYDKPKNNTALYIGIGAVALIGIGVAIYFARKK